MNKQGFCVIDGLLKEASCNGIVKEIINAESKEKFETGKLEGGKSSGDESAKVVNGDIRSDKMVWINDTETEEFPQICKMITDTMDPIVGGLNAFSDGTFVIEGRTKV